MTTYNPRINWSFTKESAQMQDLSVTEMMDGLMVKIDNSNGLSFCPTEQVEALMHLMMDEMMSRSSRIPDADE